MVKSGKSGEVQTETGKVPPGMRSQGLNDIADLHKTKTKTTAKKPKIDQRLLNMIVQNLTAELEASNLTLDDIENLKETAAKIDEKRREIAKLEEEIQELKEKVEPIAGVLRDADGMRLLLVSIGLLDDSALKLVIGDVYQAKKTRKGGKTKYVIFQGERFQSISAFLGVLKEKGLIKLPDGGFNPRRYLDAWIKRNGYTVEETETEITIKAPSEKPAKDENAG